MDPPTCHQGTKRYVCMYACQLFPSEIFILSNVRMSDNPTISKDFWKFRGSSEEFWSSEVVSDWRKQSHPLGFFSFKIQEPGVRSVIYMDQGNIWLWQIGHLQLTGSHLWAGCEKLVHRRDLALDQSFRLAGLRLMSKAWESPLEAYNVCAAVTLIQWNPGLYSDPIDVTTLYYGHFIWPDLKPI